jgi:dipeptidyl aminopeptidase/acylaminoacyl peptidase
MKKLLTAGSFVALSALAAFASGCATETKDPHTRPMNETVPNGALGNLATGPEETENTGTFTAHTTRGEGSDSDPEIARHGDVTWLYFTSDREGGGRNIVRKMPNGAALEVITRDKGDEMWPRVSPSGRYLAYGGNSAGSWDIYILDLDHRNWPAARLTASSAQDIQPTWSPDGTMIAYASDSSAESDFILSYVKLEFGAAGMNPGASMRRAQPMTIQWSELPGTKTGDDGTDGGQGFVRVSERGTMLTPQGGVVTGMHPDFRPGKMARHQLVYQDSRKEGSRWNSLKMYDMDTGKVSLIPIAEGYGAIQPRWSPSGERIVFAAVAKNDAESANPMPVGAGGFGVTTPDGGMVSDIKNPTPHKKVSAPAWARYLDEDRLFFSAISTEGASEFIASIPLTDR